MHDNLQASIDQQVKDSLLNALTEYSTTLEPPQEEVVNNVATKAKDASSETLLEMMIKLSNKFNELSAAKALSDINPRTGENTNVTAGLAAVANTGAKTAKIRSLSIRIMPSSRIEWVAAIKIACQSANEGQEMQEP